MVTIHTQDKQELITALADGGIEQKLQTLNGVRSTAVLEKLVTVEGELVFAKPPAAILDITGSAAVREVKLLAGKAVAVSYTHLDVYKRQVPTLRNSSRNTMRFELVALIHF